MKTHEKDAREPLLRIVKRDSMPIWKSMLVRLIAVVAGILVCAFLSVAVLDNVDFIKFIKTLFSGAVGSERNLWKESEFNLSMFGEFSPMAITT